MRTKDEILKEVGSLAKENPRGGIIPDLADVLIIEALFDLRDTLQYHLLRIGDLYTSFKERD